ncbi:MAG: winged helix DNA-binding domain-containing protein [Chloroflexota bacterium]|nr:winged helix DNA-binding domain-containing protein [Chloroflexota bacterium]
MRTDVPTRRQLNRATLARQMLLAREEVSAVEAVERLCGLQAQEAKPPFIGLWTRVAGFRREDLHRGLHGRAVVRATLMRATLHLMGATDYAVFRPALQPVMTQALRVLGTRGEGLDLDRVMPVARGLLGERPLTFEELRPLLVESFPQVNDRALGYAVRTHLPLVMVPTQDRWGFPAPAPFTLAESWLDAPLSDDPGATQALVLRYLAAFGPATAADVQTWSGLQGMKRVLDGLRPNLSVFKDERGRELFDLPDAPRPDAETSAPPRFLPEFDNLVLSHADRTRVLADEHRGLVVTKNLRVRATFLWDGFVTGTWQVERKRQAATLRITPFGPLPRDASDALAAEGDALLRFVEEDASSFAVEVGDPVSSG